MPDFAKWICANTVPEAVLLRDKPVGRTENTLSNRYDSSL